MLEHILSLTPHVGKLFELCKDRVRHVQMLNKSVALPCFRPLRCVHFIPVCRCSTTLRSRRPKLTFAEQGYTNPERGAGCRGAQHVSFGRELVYTLWLRRATCRKQIEDMLVWSESHPECKPFAVLFLLAYVFLLRLPSEALPAVAGGPPAVDAQSALSRQGDQLVLHLRSRKNKPQGSCLSRGCWCRASPRTCPVHVLGPLVDDHQPGAQLFQGITAGQAASMLKTMLGEVGVANAQSHVTHDIRRGHAKDLQLAGMFAVTCAVFACPL